MPTSAGSAWRVDETYVKIRGQWIYLYRTVDRKSKTVYFRLSARRNVAAAKAFVRKAVKSQAMAPSSILLDGYVASHHALPEMQEEGEVPKETTLRSSKCLNNTIEQDHRNIKLRIAPMPGFKRCKCAATTIAGTEMTDRIPKGQFLLGQLHLQSQTAPAA
ncbi:MAG: family transposase [Burkholderia sp.]|nr:family transposase [Burkholderia sp.]